MEVRDAFIIRCSDDWIYCWKQESVNYFLIDDGILGGGDNVIIN